MKEISSLLWVSLTHMYPLLDGNHFEAIRGKTTLFTLFFPRCLSIELEENTARLAGRMNCFIKSRKQMMPPTTTHPLTSPPPHTTYSALNPLHPHIHLERFEPFVFSCPVYKGRVGGHIRGKWSTLHHLNPVLPEAGRHSLETSMQIWGWGCTVAGPY